MFTYVHLCFPMFTIVYLFLFTYVYPFLLVFTYVLPMFTHIYVCLLVLSMFTSLLVFTYVFWGLFTCVYPSLPTFILIYLCLPLFNYCIRRVGKPQRRSMEALIFYGKITKTLCPSDECDKLKVICLCRSSFSFGSKLLICVVLILIVFPRCLFV